MYLSCSTLGAKIPDVLPASRYYSVRVRVQSAIRTALIQVSTEEPNYRESKWQGPLLASPETLNGSTCIFQVSVPDVDRAYQRAIDQGALPAMPPTDIFWGDRYGWVSDPFGQMWALCTVKKVLTASQVESNLKSFAAEMKGKEE